eukprot:COSAG05_NODE_21729_length_269_cov_6.423529_1_plen_73_part_10
MSIHVCLVCLLLLVLCFVLCVFVFSCVIVCVLSCSFAHAWLIVTYKIKDTARACQEIKRMMPDGNRSAHPRLF